jgi:hypothetical protein
MMSLATHTLVWMKGLGSSARRTLVDTMIAMYHYLLLEAGHRIGITRVRVNQGLRVEVRQSGSNNYNAAAAASAVQPRESL